MLTFVSRIPIFRRLFYAFLLSALIPGIIIIVLGSTFINILTLHNQAEQVSINALILSEETAPELEASYNLIQNVQSLYVSDLPQQGTSITASDIAGYSELFSIDLQTFQQEYALGSSPNMTTVQQTLLTNDPNTPLIAAQQQELKNVSHDWPIYQQDLNMVQNLILHNIPIDQKTSTRVTNDFYTISDDWARLNVDMKEISQLVVQAGPAEINPIILAVVIALLVTIALVVAIGFMVNQTITSPLRDLASLTRRIAKGETTARARARGQDEITMVATSMNNMLDNIVHLIQEVQSQRDNLQGQVEKLVSEVSGVGEGDLRIQAEVTADALGVLADSFNYMVEELGSLVIHVKMVANEVDRSTSAIMDRMNQLVETSDMEISQIEEAVTEVERMAASSRQVAERTQVLYDVARDARRNAQMGHGAVQQAISGMGRINENVQLTATRVQSLGESSREIEEIVNVISGIAHQTNRLALDAAIQAAMAGENGKGFGAVAADIRRLAERAKEQTSSITRIVRNVREEIQAVALAMQDTERETSVGADLTKEVSISLESMFSVVEHQAKEVENINVLATQQLQSSSAVVQVMHTVSDSTRQGSLSSRDASQNMERLARLVEQLRASVEAFKLRDDQSYFSLNPNSVNVSLEQEVENSLSMSGVFRTVTASAHLSGNSQGALPAPRSDGFPPSMPLLPSSPAFAPYGNGNGNGYSNGANNGNGNGYDYANSDSNGWGNMSLQPDQSWYGEPFNNGNGNNNGYTNGNADNNGWRR